MIEISPVYSHDCESCKFLSHFEDSDLYFCTESQAIIVQHGPGACESRSIAHDPLRVLMALNSSSLTDLKFRVAYLLASDMGLLPWCVNDLYVPAIKRLFQLSDELHTHYDSRRVAARVREVVDMMRGLSQSVLSERKLEPSCMED